MAPNRSAVTTMTINGRFMVGLGSKYTQGITGLAFRRSLRVFLSGFGIGIDVFEHYVGRPISLTFCWAASCAHFPRLLLIDSCVVRENDPFSAAAKYQQVD